MKTSTSIIFLTVLGITPSIYADCSVHLSHEQIMDCIVKQNDDCFRATDVMQSRPISKAEKEATHAQTTERDTLKATTDLSAR